MNGAHLHLAINHLPIWGAIFSLFFTAAAFLSKSQDLRRWSLWFALLIAVLTIPVYLTGEPAEEVIEHLSGVSEASIEKHEKTALVGMVAMVLLGLFAAFGLKKRIWLNENGRKLFALFVAANVTIALTFAWIANLGGNIRHSEIRTPAAGQVSD